MSDPSAKRVRTDDGPTPDAPVSAVASTRNEDGPSKAVLLELGKKPVRVSLLHNFHRDISHATWPPRAEGQASTLGAYHFCTALLKKLRSERPAAFNNVVYDPEYDPVKKPYFYSFSLCYGLTHADVSRIRVARAAGFGAPGSIRAHDVRSFLAREGDDVCLPETMDDRYWEVIWLTTSTCWRRILRVQINIENNHRLIKQMPARLSSAVLRRHLPRLVKELAHIPSEAVAAFAENFSAVTAKDAFVIRNGDRSYCANATLAAIFRVLSFDS
jgi:hypothetical protein